MASPSDSSVFAVIVTYNPEFEVLRQSIDSLRSQVANCVLVDNGSTDSVQAWLSKQEFANEIECIELGNNVGVAAAQNRGIEWGEGRSHSHVLLLDHDSIPGQNMVESLLTASLSLEDAGTQVAAVGPRQVDARVGAVSQFIRFGWFRFRRVGCTPGTNDIVPVDFLISSGSLIPLRSIRKIGKMDEALFIDHIDTDWCMRARYQGYSIYGVCSAEMEHRLGEAMIRIAWLGGRMIPDHKPFRSYYIFRNSLYLYRKAHAPARWIFTDLVRLVYMSVLYPIVGAEKWERIRMQMRGIRDGLRGQMGPVSAN